MFPLTNSERAHHHYSFDGVLHWRGDGGTGGGLFTAPQVNDRCVVNPRSNRYYLQTLDQGGRILKICNIAS